MSRGLCFSIQIPHVPSLRDWTESVRRAEESGFYSVSVPDHLGESQPQFAPLIMLGIAAAVSTDIRLAVTVLANDFRHPTLLAKEIATLDVLSNGRVDMGLGAGWLKEDYDATGVAPWDSPGVRVDRLEESIALLRQLFRGEKVDFHGKHYSVTAFRSFPRSVQQPVPLMLGGAGPRMLALAAREAQIVSITGDLVGVRDLRRAAFATKIGHIRMAGGFERPDLMIGIRTIFGGLTEDRDALAYELASRHDMSPEEILDSPYGMVGTIEAIRDHVLQLNEQYGLTYFTVSKDLGWDIAPLVGELSSL
jgi:probable F420-dependent oxidoreductase